MQSWNFRGVWWSLLLGGALGAPSVVFAKELLTLKDYLKQELSSSAKMAKESFTLNSDQKGALLKVAPDASEDSFTFFYGRTADGKLEKACTVVPQKGKEGPISLGVCFAPNGSLNSVTILALEEERGWKITEAPFLRQFKGKKISDAFVVGSDVDGISGATRSSRAVSEALRKSSYAFKTFVMGGIQ